MISDSEPVRARYAWTVLRVALLFEHSNGRFGGRSGKGGRYLYLTIWKDGPTWTDRTDDVNRDWTCNTRKERGAPERSLLCFFFLFFLSRVFCIRTHWLHALLASLRCLSGLAWLCLAWLAELASLACELAMHYLALLASLRSVSIPIMASLRLMPA
ncbi:hypothetical protein QBC45DRAFT_209937 [Copromyces sp. CBS 386.78]|nr:hypothetical protein QBC45DRAFT_209937 [Copromyces sp. CBS 386.78]